MVTSKKKTKPAPVKKAKAKKKPATKPATKPTPKAAPRAPKKMGRPSAYSAAVAKAFCEWVLQGYTLRQIGELPNMPSKPTAMRWLAEHEEFRDQYVRAREVLAFGMESDLLDISDDGRNDWMVRETKAGPVVVLNEEAIARSRVRIETRKWLMSKMAPKRYGDRMAVTGKDGGAVKHEVGVMAAVLDAIEGADVGIGPATSRTTE